VSSRGAERVGGKGRVDDEGEMRKKKRKVRNE